jgi:hypothetical protein
VKTASSPRLRAVSAPPAAPRAPKPPRTGVVSQVRAALQPKNRLPTALGAVLGGGVPVATYVLAHREVVGSAPLYAQLPAWLVLGGLLFSALTVYGWAREAFGSGAKALGFAALLEGVLTCSATPWLSAGALAYLVAINAVATGVRLANGSRLP